MSSSIFPSTAKGFSIEITRTATWSTIIQENVSGKEVRVARRLYPRRTWDVKFNFLRSSTVYLELQTLEAFFNNRQGAYDSFLFDDTDDDTTTSAVLGSGDSTARAFQLYRAFGGFTEPIFAPNAISKLTVGGSTVSSTTFTVSTWGSTSPGVVTFSTYAPTSTQAITADFTFYWPVHFGQDDMSFDRLVNLIWEAKKVQFTSIL